MSTAPLDPRPRLAAGLEPTTVSEAMHPGVLTCTPETTLRDVARMMARYRIHAVVVYSDEQEDRVGVWGIVSEADLIAAAAADEIDTRTAGGTARTPLITVHPGEPLRRAAELMHEYHVTHAVVVSSSRELPLGVVSSLDVARAIALEPGHPG